MTVAPSPVASQTEWDLAVDGAADRDRPVAARDARARRRTEAHADGSGRARLHFEGPDGRLSLPELFDGRSQLILYRFFFEAVWVLHALYGGQSADDGLARGLAASDAVVLRSTDHNKFQRSAAPQPAAAGSRNK